MMALLPATPEATLAALEDAAMAGEKEHPYSPPDRRTARLDVDETPWGVMGYCRVVLWVKAAYGYRAERMTEFGNPKAAAGCQRGRRPRLVYYTNFEGQHYDLTRADALSLLATFELPVPRREREPIKVSPGQPDDPFEGLGYNDALYQGRKAVGR